MHAMLNIAVRAARNAGKVVTQAYEQLDKVEATAKGANDYVTNVTSASEKSIIDTIRNAFPEHSFVSEKIGLSKGTDDEYQWVVNPLDGTTNFIKGIPHFAISIALRVRGKTEHAVVYDPLRNELFAASRGKSAQLDGYRLRVNKAKDLEGTLIASGFPYRRKHYTESYTAMFGAIFAECDDIRSSGSPALDIAYVAAGRYDGFFRLNLKPWEIAAGELLVREAGAIVTDVAGNTDFYQSGNVVCANPKVLKHMLSTIRPHLTDAIKG
ncbi:inositol-1-monophosphatase [Agarivorans sp. MS3-6]|uniref:inositol-1-monophosphatase n=1 Tax=Agarivorans sp. TSD2052 TaxID=2937286 RepID=UPI00200DC671|nr:inositol-1-monophosphatase [Agarivorans sp. TSD2052]UPW17203.1 inositol-1-monophosphatase [Agarivorans sp. TSD2052]